MRNAIIFETKEALTEKRDLMKIIRVVLFILILFAYVYFSVNISLLKQELDDQKHEYNKKIEILSSNVNILHYEKESLLETIESITNDNNELTEKYNSLLNEKMIRDENIVEKYVPTGAGATKSYMSYTQKWNKSTRQYRLHNSISSDVEYDEYGYAMYDNRYFVAVKPYYGQVGDYIDVYQEDGTILPCIIGDNKGSENDNKYIHYDGSIVEFMVKSGFKGVKQTRPEFCQTIMSIKNLGNYFDI